MKTVQRLVLTACVSSLLGFAWPAQAYVAGQVSVSASNVRVDTTPGVSFGWTDDWHGRVASEAVHSVNGAEANSDESFANDASLNVTATAGLVTGSAGYEITDGLNVAAGDGAVGGEAASSLELISALETGSSESFFSFDNRFRITGGVGGTVVPVTLLLDYNYSVDATSDAAGEWELLTELLLSVFDADDFANDPDNVDPLETVLLTFGDSAQGVSSLSNSGSGTFELQVLLEIEKEYYFTTQGTTSLRGANADDPVVDVAEPSVISLMFAGLLGAGFWRRRQS